MANQSIFKKIYALRTSLIFYFLGSFVLIACTVMCTSRAQESKKLVSFIQEQGSDFGPSVIRGQRLTLTDLTVEKPLIPGDIYRDPNGAVHPDHEDLATFAWLEFIALVSGSSTQRGVPGGSFENSGKNPDQTLNWQTYHHRTELFPYRPKGEPLPPKPWDATPSYVMFYQDKEGATIPYTVPFTNYTNLDEASQIAENLLFFPAKENTRDPLNDYQALFEAKVNKVSWGYVNDNYTTLNNITPKTYPNGITQRDGTIHLKATWRPLASIAEKEQYKYFVSEGIYYDGEDNAPVAKIRKFALIGLHIIHKTPNYPSFIFATFEHRDNLKGGTYYVPTYKEIQIALPDSVPTFSGDSLYSPNPFPQGYTKKPYAMPNGKRIPIPNIDVGTIAGVKRVIVGEGKYVYTVPVTQPPTTNQMVANVNQHALGLMQQLQGFDKNFIWQYYFLKGVQSIPTNDESVPDYYLANNVTESSAPGIQLFRGGQSISFDIDGQPLENRRNELNVIDAKQHNNYFSMGGCMGCHGISKRLNGFDFSFLYFGAGSGYAPDVIGIKEREEFDALLKKYNLSERRFAKE
ncbi:hypothetical protein AB832_06705 [Flavobacteriaceae bacterium (ex Bugula neritina AB1)]|nr:hypothetical protein AB832_06705 [Flavobacteriaceae bacterium (ex Bugula neritina AB1)]